MKFDLIEAMTVTIKRPQLRRISVSVEAKLNGFRLAQRCAQRGQPRFRPTGTLAPDRFAQHGVG